MREKISEDIRQSIAVKEAVGRTLVPAIEQAVQWSVECLKSGHKLIFFGNGGSASDSQHLAAEFVGRYEKERRSLPAISLTVDTSALTAIANDYGYERVFERQLEGLGRPGDLAFAISTSGNSKNVLLAVEKCRKLGIRTVGLSGRGGGKMNSLVDLSIVVPSDKTSRVQEAHIMIGHILCERVDELL